MKIFIILTCLIAWYLMQAAAYFGIFRKAGQGRWKALVPFYNGYTQLKLSGIKWMFWIFLIALAAPFAAQYIEGFEYLRELMIGCAGVAGLVHIIASFRLAKCFGRGFVFALGLIILEPVFMLVLGLGDSEYSWREAE